MLGPTDDCVQTHSGNNSKVVSPNILGCKISGDVNFNTHVQNVSPSTSGDKDEIFQNLKNEMKTIMEKECSRTFEGCASKPVGLNKMYTELFIINDDSDPINTEHEIWQDEKTHEFNTSPHTVVTYNQILQSPDDRDETVKIVLTKGIAGIGKTVTIRKFILDWANGKANQDLELVFLLPFRELNLLEGEKSLLEVLFDFYPTLKKAKQISEWICDRKVLFILDGLDEYRQPLNFKSRLFSSETEKATVDVLLVNLLLGKLLPSAHLWITSRPVAAGQLPSHIFKHGYKTQIRGFRDEQKEKYFKSQFDDPALSQKVISHLKSQKSLWILCHIPLFSWITSYVLKHITAKQNLNQSMPSNQTEMYIHYLLIQTGLSHKKYKVEELSEEHALQEHRDQIMNMAELAYWQLREQKAIFRKEDLMKYNIIVDEATQHPGILTCISQYKCMFYNRITLFSFVHLTVQEFFAALFAFHEFLLEKQDSLSLRTGKKKDAPYLSNFLKDVIDVALQSENGHMDLFTCFLFGISCDSNKLLLEAFLPPFRGNISQEHRKVTKHIKSLRRKDLSSERCVSLIRCLLELKDKSFLQNLQALERSQSKKPLTLFQCTLLAYQLRMSDEKHIKFDLRKYNITLEGFQRLSSAFRYVRKALLKGSGLTEHHCMSLVPYLRLPKTHLTDLNLSYNGLGRSALAYLTPALSDPNCQIQILNLSHNDLQSQDMELIRDVLTGANVNLKVLDLSENQLEDSGVQILSDGLQSDNCHLKVLKISGCQIQIRGVHYLLSSLKQHPLYLRELDLRYNILEDTGLENLWAELSSLRVSTGGVCGRQPGLHKYMVALTFDPKTANDRLLLNEDNTLATRLKRKMQLLPNEQRFDTCNQVLSHQRLTGRCFFTVDVIGPHVHVGVACKGLERKGSSSTVCLGHNKMSWSLRCSRNECVAYHDKKRESVQTTESIGRLGVFVDQEAGSVCFYRMIPQVQLLYMFDADFPEDQELYAAFRIQKPNSSVDLDENCSMLG
ncbi:NACHT, LRR and PYD domains-containing protein 12 [Danio aesculapii]|uniref:NACHT, LRR and PYD domains-containing protein 12 n=1 Tax=Danio aesculapii TaxID=1142201 RepID=UPI0024C04A0D|nr:NACHT, LRR and PYD domains-containing protein 12 [Danio aesculapii]